MTVAEQAPDPADYPDADPALLVPGALVFQPTAGPVDQPDESCDCRVGGRNRLPSGAGFLGLGLVVGLVALRRRRARG